MREKRSPISYRRRYAATLRLASRSSTPKGGAPDSADALPQTCPYSLDDIYREDWYPHTPGEKS